MTETEWRRAVALACDRNGPPAVSEAALQAMAADCRMLAAVGLSQGARNLPALNLAMRTAFELMDPDERAADLAGASIALAMLPPVPGGARGRPADDGELP